MTSVAGSEQVPQTYEGIADLIVGMIERKGGISRVSPTPWDSFERLSALIHAQFTLGATSISAMMRRLLFALAVAKRPKGIVGVGTATGYALSWLLRDRHDDQSGPHFSYAVGMDVDAGANETARKNCETLGHGTSLEFMDCDGLAGLREWNRPIDLLYVDLDDPQTGKDSYRDVVDAAIPSLAAGAFVLAHDPCIPIFRNSYARYDDYVRGSGRFLGPWVFPVDEAGLSLSVFGASRHD